MRIPQNLRLLLSFTLLVFCSTHELNAQTWSWAYNAQGNQSEGFDRDIAVDRNGTIFIAGYFTQNLQLGTFTLVNTEALVDMYLAKMDSAGNVIWAKSFDLGFAFGEHIGMILDDSNNIFVTGVNGGRIFVSKFDSSGVEKWKTDLMQFGQGSDIALDQYDNLYVTAFNNGNSLVVKLDENGRLIWSREIFGGGFSNGCWGNDIAVDRFGNSYMAGGFFCDSIVVGTIVFRRVGGGSERNFIVKYSPAGEVLWAKSPNGKCSTNPQVTLTDLDEIYFSGTFNSNQITFENIIVQHTIPNSTYSAFLARYDKYGNLAWAKDGKKYESNPRDLVPDHDGNLYFAGISFGNWGGTEMDFHLIKYNSQGDTFYTREVLPGHEHLYAIDIDNWGNNYVIGNSGLQGIGIFPPGTVIPNTIFVAKFNTGGTTRRRPSVPQINKRFVVCDGEPVPTLNATGDNIKWYSDSLLDNLVAIGNNYTPGITQTDTFYVTQTVNGITSWPKQVIVYFSTLINFSIERRGDTLFAPMGINYTYQWFRDSLPISTGGQNRFLKTQQVGDYFVQVKDMNVCVKEAACYVPIDTIASVSICPGSVKQLTTRAHDSRFTYQWSVDSAAGFVEISDNSNFSGCTTRTLVISGAPSSFYGYKFRCTISSNGAAYPGEVFMLKFSNEWTGADNNAWENPLNWSCGQLPDANTDVQINFGNVLLSSNTTIRSLTIRSGASLTVAPGITLTITH